MRELKLFLLVCGFVILLVGLWEARDWLPGFGHFLLVGVGVGISLCLAFLFLIVIERGVKIQGMRKEQQRVIFQHALMVESPQGYMMFSANTQPRQLDAPSPITVPAPREIVESVPVAPPFRNIVHLITPGHLFLGQGMQGAIWGDITDLLSTIIAGRPGSGKTTKLREVCAQVLCVDGLPILFDPHGSIVDDLGTSFQCAESPSEIADQSKWLLSQLDMRLQKRRVGMREFQPMLLLVDELPVISEICEGALAAIRRIVLEGRKVGMYALVSGQGIPASILGGTLVRDAMASRYVFCTTPQQARMAGIENEVAKRLLAQLEDAGPGKAILATSRSRPEIVAIPDTTVDDIRMLVSRTQRTVGLGNHREVAQEGIGSVCGASPSVSTTGILRDIGKRLKNGETPDEIRKELGIDGGRAHQEVTTALKFLQQEEEL